MAFKVVWPWKKQVKNESSGVRKKRRIYNRIKKARIYHTELEMDSLGSAIDAAKDPENPSFDDLYNIYDQIKKDRHLKSQVQLAINDIQQSPFILKVDGKEDKELKELFDTEWMDDAVQFLAEAEFWGHSLIEFPEVNEDQEFDESFLIPRENVNPAKQRIILDKDKRLYLPYEGQQKKLNLVEAYGIEELGLYEYLAEEVILKKYARTDWSQASERYGMPFLDYATDTEDEKELNRIEEMAANFATNGYIVRHKDDDVEIKQPSNGDFYKIYMNAISLGNEELSKAINGQTGTSDNQAWAGTADVHERVKNTFTKARLRRVQHHINGKVLPLMVQNGYKNADRLQRAKWQYTDLLDEAPTLNTDPSKENGQSQGGDQGGQAQAKGKAKKTVAASDPLDEWLKRFFNDLSKSKKVAIDPAVWRMNFDSLLKAMTDSGLDFSASYQYADLAAELRTNAASFAAFKNHDEQRALRDLLVDDKGEPRSLADFKKAAKPLTEQYNKEWLQTEFKQAQASSQMAVKWEGFKQEADIYPNLEYRAVHDSDTRPDHARLDGTIRPINDKFWSKYYPPNGWGCRCDVVQTDKAATDAPDGFTPDGGFDFNPGKDGKLFSEDNGYQKSVNEADSKGISQEADKLLNDFLNNDQ